jgi:hypothetical protein
LWTEADALLGTVFIELLPFVLAYGSCCLASAFSSVNMIARGVALRTYDRSAYVIH